jgi:hypothetical protein
MLVGLLRWLMAWLGVEAVLGGHHLIELMVRVGAARLGLAPVGTPEATQARQINRRYRVQNRS